MVITEYKLDTNKFFTRDDNDFPTGCHTERGRETRSSISKYPDWGHQDERQVLFTTAKPATT